MLLSDEFAIGRVTAREAAERNREIEMARNVREEKARRRRASKARGAGAGAMSPAPASAIVVGAESLLRARAEHPAGTGIVVADDARELQSARR
ncbi:hypothetical protein [Leifsonia poae]|uniref:hypothetical protein n=1 Tax=Leifsonia poae TaxID=110933 RepID=UPI003D66455F